MRKLLFQMLVSVDGYFEGPKGRNDIDWHLVDDEFNAYAARMLDSVDTLVFGRVTYEGMASFWPTPEAMAADPVIAPKMNNLKKIVVSRTLQLAEWNNTRLIKGNLVEEFTALKKQPGKELIILGSSALTVSLMELGLVDEFRIMVTPVVLGGGTPLFKGLKGKFPLRLVKTETHQSGNVIHYYEPVKS